VWMFSLNGDIGPYDPAADAALAAQQASLAAMPVPAPDPDHAADLEHGAALYRDACLPCHGASGRGGEGGGAPLTEGVSMETIMAVTFSGRNRMPSFAGVYSPPELQD